MFQESSLKKKIEEDNKDVREMVLASKYGRWPTMSDILNKKPHLVNCIPEERSWAILHQAVFWDNLDVVKDILQFKTCDALIKTKKSREGIVPAASTAIDIVNAMGARGEIKNAISSNICNERAKRFDDTINYKVSRQGNEKTFAELPLFVREMAMYKDTLFDGEKLVKDHLIDLMKQIFKAEQHNCHWQKVQEQMLQSLYAFDKDSVDDLIHATDEVEYFRQLIRIYTDTWVHKALNEALSREFKADYNPTAQDLAVGLYGLLLDITIVFWDQLKTTEYKTYRGVPNKYGDFQPGKEIMFTSFISCSGDDEVAKGFAGSHGTLFEFVNSEDAKTRPKHIQDFSKYPSEDEYLYTIGTEFRIESVLDDPNGLRKIQLKLLKSCQLCKKP